ncbi:MAG TPA: hypothetical protein VNT26_13790, partial [Candidatus Sulfotelmatobacter sp.]|nr:hypothetical protein [Candidatus Sulfotelmatobacter sp.]
MSNVELTNALFAELAGWEAVKQARSLLAAERVLASEWQPPLLRGTVQAGTTTYRAGLVIKSAGDAENLCPCRDSRARGIICAHSVAIGLHYLRAQTPSADPAEKKLPAAATATQAPVKASAKALRRAIAGEPGEPLEIALVLPPNLPEALAKGKVMLYWEARWRKGRVPLNALPFDEPFTLSDQDAALLTAVETLNEGDTPAMVMLNGGQFTELLPKLVAHPRVTLGKAQALEILDAALRLSLQATLEPNGEIVLRLSGTLPKGLIQGATAWVFSGQRLQPLGLPVGLEELFRGPMRLPRSRVPLFL